MNIKNPSPETHAAFVAVRDLLLADLQKSGLAPEQVASEVFRVSVMMAAEACSGLGRFYPGHQVLIANHFVASLSHELSKTVQPAISHIAQTVRNLH